MTKASLYCFFSINLNLFGITEAFARFDQLLSNWGKTNIKKLIKEGTDYTLQDATYEVSGFINSELIKDKIVYAGTNFNFTHKESFDLLTFLVEFFFSLRKNSSDEFFLKRFLVSFIINSEDNFLLGL